MHCSASQEYGFSSTSTDKAQALSYAGGGADHKDGDASTIFEMQMGMVDRGANLTWLSQYPHEAEGAFAYSCMRLHKPTARRTLPL